MQLNEQAQYDGALCSVLPAVRRISYFVAARAGELFLMTSLRCVETSASDHTLTQPHTRNPQLNRCENLLCLKVLTLRPLILLRKAVLRDDVEHFCSGTARRLAHSPFHVSGVSERRLTECHPVKLKLVYIFQN